MPQLSVTPGEVYRWLPVEARQQRLKKHSELNDYRKHIILSNSWAGLSK